MTSTLLYLEALHHLLTDTVAVIEDLGEVPRPQHVPDHGLRFVPDVVTL